jgi:LmbE family N-acetylglucosaminyl deacetylase
VPELVAAVPARALAVYAHPDDAEVSCGGALARWAAAGASVDIVVCTRGDKGSSDPAVRPDELAALRREEAKAAGAVLGVQAHHFLDHPDGEVDNNAAFRSELVAIVRAVKPDVVVCPDPEAVFFGQSYFNHRDHREVGWATLDAVAPAAGNPHYFPTAGPAHRVDCVYLSGTLAPDAWIDITASVDIKAEALLCHRSQLGETGEWLRTAVRERAEQAGRVAGVAYAEGFRRLVLGGSPPPADSSPARS